MPKKLFKPGNGGRPKGSKNKSITRSRIAAILNDENTWTKFATELKKLRGRAYCDTLVKLFEYDTPRFSSINFSLSNMSEQDLEFLVSHLKQQMNEPNESDQ
jgi:hypothetical protein